MWAEPPFTVASTTLVLQRSTNKPQVENLHKEQQSLHFSKNFDSIKAAGGQTRLMCVIKGGTAAGFMSSIIFTQSLTAFKSLLH